MIIGFLVDSPFFGGPERQLLELSRHLLAIGQTPTILIFPDGEKHLPFLEQLRRHDVPTVVLDSNWPNARATIGEVTRLVREREIELLCTQGYKGDLLGLAAARWAGVPVMAISRGWTAQTARVRIYEVVDRLCLRRMDRVVCVSEGQAAKVRRAGVRPEKVVVIHNAIRADRFDLDPDRVARSSRPTLEGLFRSPPGRIVGAAGRLSPEKGFDTLIEAAALVVREAPEVGFVQFGDGRLREALQGRIAALGLEGRFILAGFRGDLDELLPGLDLVALPSRTEGLPNIALEAGASGLPVVATAVGGTPEVVEDGVTGYLVPPDRPDALAGRILDVLRDEELRRTMGRRGLDRVRASFTTEAQAERYLELFEGLAGRPERSGLAHGRMP